MTLFVDASVIVAIVCGEPDADQLMERLERDGGPYLVSPIVRLEATLAIAREIALLRQGALPAGPAMVAQARAVVDQFAADLGAREVAVDEAVGARAIEAAARFGTLVGHPARLNMGDCLAYACARQEGAGLAFKGEGFPQTDLDWSGLAPRGR